MEAAGDARPLQVPHERLLRRLTKLLRARRRPVLVICACASPSLRARVERELRARLDGRAVVAGELTGERDPWTTMIDAREASGGRRDAVLSFSLPRGERPEAEVGVLDRLNVGRENIAREEMRVVLWASGLAQHERLRADAPDLWAHRAEVFVFLTAEEFALPPPGEGQNVLAKALDEVNAALARETVGAGRDVLRVMRAVLLFVLGGSVDDVSARDGSEAAFVEEHLARAARVISSGDVGAFLGDTQDGTSTLQAKGIGGATQAQRAYGLVGRGRVGEAAPLLRESMDAMRAEMSGKDVPPFLETSLRLSRLPLLGEIGRHRAVLAEDLTFAPPTDATATAAMLVWMGAWPPAILTRATSLHRTGETFAALRELHDLLWRLAALSARRFVDSLVGEIVRIYADVGLPGEALRTLDLADRDDLRAPGTESDLAWTRLRARAHRAAGAPEVARAMVAELSERFRAGALQGLPETMRLAREFELLRLRVDFDDAADVADSLESLRAAAGAAHLDDLTLYAADALRDDLVRRARFDRALAVCRDVLSTLNDAWGASIWARWHVYAAQTLLSLGRAVEASAEGDIALQLWQRDLPAHRSLPLRSTIAVVRARALAALSRADEAVVELRDAIALLREEDSRLGVVELLNALAELPLPDAHRPAREAAAREALGLARAVMVLAGEARAMLNLVSLAAPELPSTAAMLDEGLWLARATGDDELARHAAQVERDHALRLTAHQATRDGH